MAFSTSPQNQLFHIQDALNHLQYTTNEHETTIVTNSQPIDVLTTWHQVLNILGQQLSLPSVEMWLLPMQAHSIEIDSADQANIILFCPSAFNQLWVSRHYLKDLQDAFKVVLLLDNTPQITLKVYDDVSFSPKSALSENNSARTTIPNNAPMPAVAAAALPNVRANLPLQPVPAKPVLRQGTLNPKYTLANLIIGEHNQFAVAAAKAVIARPGQQYNPLFIHGDVGLGKTHLMQAIGHALITQDEALNYCYITTEQFANEMIAAINNKTIKRFQDRFRGLDLLMMDDIQFLEGKQRTQEEVFHIFNALVDQGKQIIFTSDRPPTQLTRLENRLTSRFASGLTVDITLPTVDAKKAMIAHKAKVASLTLDTPLVDIIANQYVNNVRELEGMLTKLSAYQLFNQKPVTESVLFDLIGITDISQKQNVIQNQSLCDRLQQIAIYYNVSVEDLQSASRKKTLNETRQTVIYILRELTGASYPQLGELLGNRSHSNILLAYKKMVTLLEDNMTLKHQMDKILQQFK